MQPVSTKELEVVLHWFRNDKKLGHNGWTVEFFLSFYEQISPNLLKVVEECHTSGQRYGAFNSTFIALIPKSYDPTTFDD